MNFTPAGTNDAARAGGDDWFTPGRFAVLLGLLIVVTFSHVVVGVETFFFRDYGAFGYPLAFYTRESYWRGEIPLWNPYSDCGLPFLAQWNTLTLYPLSLFYVLFPLPWSLSVFCLGHLFLAGMGMYFLAYSWTGNRLAAAVGGVAFAYNGLTWHALMWPNDIAALGWMPWVVLAVECGWREGGRGVVLAGLVGGMQMLAGAPEVIMLTWVFAGGQWVMEWIWGGTGRLKMVGRGALMVVLVVGLAAAQLLPFLELLAHSHRDSSYGGTDWAMPVSGLANYLVPQFHAREPAGQGVFVPHGQYWTSSYYAGVGVVMLGLAAVWRVRERRVWYLAGMVILSVLMAMGDDGVIYPAIKRVMPELGFMRFPIKFVVLATFALPLLAAEGLARMRRSAEQDFRAQRKRLFWLALILIGLTAFVVFRAVASPQGEGDFSVTLRSAIRSTLFMALVAGCAALYWTELTATMRKIAQAVLILLFWMDIFTQGANLSPTVLPWVYKADQMRQYLHWDSQVGPGEARVMQSREMFAKIYHGTVDNSEADFNGRRLAFAYNFNLLDHVPKLDGFYSLYLREMNGVISELYISSNDLPHLKDFVGIARENLATNTIEWVPRDGWSPVVTAGQQAVFGTDAQAFRLLFDTSFDGRKVVCLPPEASEVVRATNRTPVTILATNFTAERIDLRVDSPGGPGMVVVAQAYYPAWRAYVDGKPVKLWRANYAFQALEVQSGQHEVEIVYQDRKFEAGCMISLAALLVCGGIWVIGTGRSRALVANIK